jgi:hypothetical protein
MAAFALLLTICAAVALVSWWTGLPAMTVIAITFVVWIVVVGLNPTNRAD